MEYSCGTPQTLLFNEGDAEKNATLNCMKTQIFFVLKLVLFPLSGVYVTDIMLQLAVSTQTT